MSGSYSDDMRKILDMLDDITEDEAGVKALLTESDTLEQLEEGPRWDKFKSQVKSKNPFSKAGRTKAKGDLRTRKLAQTWENAWHDHAGQTGTEQTVDDLAAFLQHQVKFVPQAIQQIISTATGHNIALNGNAQNDSNANNQNHQNAQNAKGPEDPPNNTQSGQQPQQGQSSPTLSTSTSFTHNPGTGSNWGQPQDHTVTNNPTNTTNTPVAGNTSPDAAKPDNVDNANNTDSMDDNQVKTAMTYLNSSLKQQNNADAQKTVLNLHRNFGKISDDLKPQVASALIKAGENLVNSKTVSADDLEELKKDVGKFVQQPATTQQTTPVKKPVSKRPTTQPQQGQPSAQKQKVAASYLNLGNLLKECGDDILEETSEYKSYIFEDGPEEGPVGTGSMPLNNTEIKKIFYAAAQYAVKKGLVGSRNNNGTGYNGSNYNNGGNNTPGSNNISPNNTGPNNLSNSPQNNNQNPQGNSSNLGQATHMISQFTDLNDRTVNYIHGEVYNARSYKDVDTKHKDSLAKIGYAYLKSLR